MFSLVGLCGVIVASFTLNAAPSLQRALVSHKPTVRCGEGKVPAARVSDWSIRFLKTLDDSGGVEEYDLYKSSRVIMSAPGAAHAAYATRRGSSDVCDDATIELRDHLESYQKGACEPPDSREPAEYSCVLQSEACKDRFDVVLPLALDSDLLRVPDGYSYLTLNDEKRKILLTTSLVTFEWDGSSNDRVSDVSWQNLDEYGIDISDMQLDEAKEIYFTRISSDGRKQRLFIDINLRCEGLPAGSSLS